jgi:hypothetical protein
MFVVTIETDDGEWLGTTVLNGDQLDEHKALCDAAEKAGLRWQSVRPDSYEDLMAQVTEGP